ncbi:hypothetical protein AB1Y20_002427 [Prymnesium parvum]|uniref:Abscisic acid G-protein coupled receptor-like domain-containing protein n=1 Tax=Prymnesium parvum TaxID=97485 RepID=A0AB34JAV3_PRYPA
MALAVEAAAFICLCSLPLYRAGAFAYTMLMPSTAARQLFAMSFTLSVSLLLLILLEVLGVLTSASRSLLWRVCLGLDLVLLVAVLPYVQISILLVRALSFPEGLARHAAIGPMLLWLWLFYKLGKPFPLLAEESFWYLQSLCLSRAGMIGVSVTAAMSGVGAVNGPASSLSRLLFTISEEELHSAERRLLRALHAVLQHRTQLRELLQLQDTLRSLSFFCPPRFLDALVQQDLAERQQASRRVELVARVKRRLLECIPLLLRLPAYRTASAEVRRARREERVLLAALHRQFWVVSELVTERERSRFALTWRGRLYNWLGYIFSAYCVLKMWSAARSILGQHAKLGEDIVTRALRISLRLMHLSDADVSTWSQAISLALVGVMIFSSVRGFLVQAYRLRLRTASPPRSNAPPKTSDDIMGYVAAHVMGFYFLSSVLLTRASLPSQFRNGISEAVGTNLEYAFYHHWFDSIFLTAACSTLVAFSWHRVEQERRRRGSNPDATLMASQRMHHAVQASARRQEIIGRERTAASYAAAAAPAQSSAPRGVPPPSPLRSRREGCRSGVPEVGRQSRSEINSYPNRREAGQESASAMVAGATAAAAKGTAALLEYVSAQMAGMDSTETWVALVRSKSS